MLRFKSALGSLVLTTPKRTFLLFPLISILAQLVYPLQFGRYNVVALVILPIGYLQYRLCGEYVGKHGLGSHEPKNPPTKLVTTGPYRYVRNPMYIGHLIFLVGVVLFLSSYVSMVLLIVQIVWLNSNALKDEKLLYRRYGEDYLRYKNSVPRWIPRPPRAEQT